MDQYKDNNGEEKWIGLRMLNDGLVGVIVTDDVNAYNDEQEATLYLNSKMTNYKLHIIVLSDNANNNLQNVYSNKVIINNKDNSIVYSSPNLLPLANALIEILNGSKKVKAKSKSLIITIALIAINVLIYIISSLISGSIADIDAMTLLRMGAKYNPYINRGEIWRLFTSTFLHGGIIHITCNMYSLYAVGGQVERIYGKVKYILIYILSALGASALSYLLDPRSLSVGASGAIFGVFGALLVYVIKAKDRLNKGALVNLLAVLGLNLYIGLTIPNIDNFAHIGGLVTGIITSIICVQDVNVWLGYKIKLKEIQKLLNFELQKNGLLKLLWKREKINRLIKKAVTIAKYNYIMIKILVNYRKKIWYSVL